MKAHLLTMSLATALAAQLPAQRAASSEWPAYGGDPGGHRFAALDQITRTNVGSLRLAWVYRTGDLMNARGRFEATPLLVDGMLYVSTPLGRVVALDPATGAERWTFDARVDLTGDYGDLANRGVATWLDTRSAAGATCRRRIYLGTVDARLIAVDAATGMPCVGFGTRGTIDLTYGLLNAPAYSYEYEVTSPPTVVGDIVIVGSAISDNQRADAPNGVVRAYDARTGVERWSWDPVPRNAGVPGYDTWQGSAAHSTGAANAWTVMSADPARDLVFVPTGSASPDFFGGVRLGQNLYANSVVALRASTGQVVWHFQVVHHDLWDYDVPAQPVAFTLHRSGRDLPALAVATKMGHLFILDRTTGTPLVPVEERPVPRSDVPDEHTWPTQPFPPAAYRFVPETLATNDAFGMTPEARARCRAWIAGLRSEGIFSPPSLRGSINYPGHIGGFNWSGVSVDERNGLLIAPVNRLAMVVTLIPRDSLHAMHMAHPDEEISPMRGTPYGMMRQTLISPERVPCTPPPWGELVGFDLADGRVKWRVPLGSWPGTGGRDDGASLGSISLGGTLLTSGGLAFVAATLDQNFRAFDLQTGRELWSAPLPAGGHALPMTYMAGGRQYVVIAAGGHDRLRTTMGDYVLAYTLSTPGAPARDTAAREMGGSWVGEMRISDTDRHPTTLTLRAAGDSLTGETSADSGRITGTVAARARGSALTFVTSFTYPEKRCGGTISGEGVQANGGNLLVGTLRVVSSCSRDLERGTFSFRRAKG
ncbi:MAG TPA: pyrroloquinoline quinone-dependent dehydrogenase [Gemmatimonadales bacterium]